MCPELLIAVVDNDSSVSSALTRLIRSCGFRVRAFSSGAEFLRYIDDHEPDCVLLDVNMPEMNGWEVQSHLSCANADIPVIVISGEHDLGALARAKRNGAQHYLLQAGRRGPIARSNPERYCYCLTTADGIAGDPLILLSPVVAAIRRLHGRLIEQVFADGAFHAAVQAAGMERPANGRIHRVPHAAQR